MDFDFSWHFESRSAAQTECLGAALGARLQAGDLICLQGDLGAGKTVFCRGIGAGFGALPPLTSPTYNLVHEHRRAQDTTLLHHIDLYRIQRAEDAESLGIYDILDSAGVVLIEWAERLAGELPPQYLRIRCEHRDASSRGLSFAARGKRYVTRLQELAAAAYVIGD